MSIARLIVLCVHNVDVLHSFSLVTGSVNMIWLFLLSRFPLVISVAITSSQFPRHKSLVIFKFFLLCFPCPVCHHILFEITFTSFLTRIALQEYGWNMATNSLISSPLVVSLFRYTRYMIPQPSQSSVLISSYHLRITVVQIWESGCLSSDSITCNFVASCLSSLCLSFSNCKIGKVRVSLIESVRVNYIVIFRIFSMVPSHTE